MKNVMFRYTLILYLFITLIQFNDNVKCINAQYEKYFTTEREGPCVAISDTKQTETPFPFG